MVCHYVIKNYLDPIKPAAVHGSGSVTALLNRLTTALRSAGSSPLGLRNG
jgi:hypothetical protein